MARTNAERQKAYRDRKKQQKAQELDMQAPVPQCSPLDLQSEEVSMFDVQKRRLERDA